METIVVLMTLWGESSGQAIPEQMKIQFVETYMRHQGPLLRTWNIFNPTMDK